MNTKQPTIAVVTSTIGRPELERAILSVQQQNHPCRHYVFVDGEQYFEQVKTLAAKHSDVVFTYLPMNTGSDGWTNSHINAIAPFLVKEDIICYLDDDNWYEPHHTQVIADAFTRFDGLEIAYTLRRLMTEHGEYICDDNSESLGFFQLDTISFNIELNGEQHPVEIMMHRGYLVDTNCLAMNVQTARALAHCWTFSRQNDAYIWKQCLQQKRSIMATAQHTVNYTFNPKAMEILIGLKLTPEQRESLPYHVIKTQNQIVLDWQSPREWHRPSIFVNGALVFLETE